MCGRFLMNEDILEDVSELVPMYEDCILDLHFGEIFPSMNGLVIEGDHDRLKCAALPFGFYSESMKKRIINARSEGIADKRMFQSAFAHHRCVVAASAFYEWTPRKEKIEFTRPSNKAMYLAAIVLDDSFVILTKDADASVAPYHHRMPVILSKDEAVQWIFDFHAAQPLIKQAAPKLDASGHVQMTLF